MATQKFLLGHVKGDKGVPGDPGQNGVTPVLTVTAEGTEDEQPSVLQSGKSGEISLTFKIPRGAKGDPGKQGEPGKAPTWTKIDKTILTTEWKNDASPYTCTIEVSDLTATQLVFVTNNPGIDQATIDAFASACITAGTQDVGSFTLQAVNKPAMDLPIVILIGGETTAAES